MDESEASTITEGTMKVRGYLIRDFLDLPDVERREGKYTFEEHDQPYLIDIPERYWYYRVLQDAAEGKVGTVAISYQDQYVREVFSTTTASVFTYVDRPQTTHATYSATLALALEEPGSSVVMYGPSKVGKSALWKHVLGTDCVVVPCSPDGSLEDHYHAALFELRTSWVSSNTETRQAEAASGSAASVSLGAKDIASGKLAAQRTSKKSEKTEEVQSYLDQPINAKILSQAVGDRGFALVFENFHRLSESSFRRLCIDLRTFADEEVTTIFVGIPQDPYEFVKINQELLGRMVFMKFDHWPEDDLKKIPLNGSEPLNVTFKDTTLEFLAAEAAGSPLLMQLYSLITCLASRVTRTKRDPLEIDLSYDDFELGVTEFGRLYLEPCGAIWKDIEKVANGIKSVPENFLSDLRQCLSEATLSAGFEDLGGITMRGLRALVGRLNKREFTKDVLRINESERTLEISHPSLVSYLRWLV